MNANGRIIFNIDKGIVELHNKISDLEEQYERMDLSRSKTKGKHAGLMKAPAVRHTNKMRLGTTGATSNNISESRNRSCQVDIVGSCSGCTVKEDGQGDKNTFTKDDLTWSELLQLGLKGEQECKYQHRKQSKGYKPDQTDRPASKTYNSPPTREGRTPRACTPRHEGCFIEHHTAKKHQNKERLTYEKPWQRPAKIKTGSRKGQCDKAVDCELWKEQNAAASTLLQELSKPAVTTHSLLAQLKARPLDQETRRLVVEVEQAIGKLCINNEKKYHSSIHPLTVQHNIEHEPVPYQDNNYVIHLRKSYWESKKLCEALQKEKQALNQEIIGKDQVIATLKQKEVDSAVVMSNLKIKWEKVKKEVMRHKQVEFDLTSNRNQLTKQTQVLGAYKKAHEKTQEQLQKYLLANDELKAELRLSLLTQQKLTAVLALKDKELKTFNKCQVCENFQLLNGTHGTTNALENSMFERTLWASQAEFNSQRTDLVHSSPVSTKGSCLDSSWNRLSSIHESNVKQDVAVLTFPPHKLSDPVHDFAAQYEAPLGEPGCQMTPSRQVKNLSFTSCDSIMPNIATDGLDESLHDVSANEMQLR